MFSASPLTQAQTDQWVAIRSTAPGSGLGGKVLGEEVDWDKALAEASAVLSETQLAALKAHAGLLRVVQKLPQFFDGRPAR